MDKKELHEQKVVIRKKIKFLLTNLDFASEEVVLEILQQVESLSSKLKDEI